MEMMEYKEYRELCEEYNHSQQFPKARKEAFLEKHKFYIEEYERFIENYEKAEDKQAYLRDRYLKQQQDKELLIYVCEWKNKYKINPYVRNANKYYFDVISAI